MATSLAWQGGKKTYRLGARGLVGLGLPDLLRGKRFIFQREAAGELEIFEEIFVLGLVFERLILEEVVVRGGSWAK